MDNGGYSQAAILCVMLIKEYSESTVQSFFFQINKYRLTKHTPIKVYMYVPVQSSLMGVLIPHYALYFPFTSDYAVANTIPASPHQSTATSSIAAPLSTASITTFIPFHVEFRIFRYSKQGWKMCARRLVPQWLIYWSSERCKHPLWPRLGFSETQPRVEPDSRARHG